MRRRGFEKMALAAMGVLAAVWPRLALADQASPTVPATQPADQRAELTAEMQAIRARIAALEAQQKVAAAKQAEATRQQEEAATSNALAQDAVQHDQFLAAEGFTAGYSDGKFTLQSADGNFSFHPGVYMQFREVFNDRSNYEVINKKEGRYDDQINDGFEMRRMKFTFDGNLFGKDLTYNMVWGTQRTSSNATVSGATPATKGGTVTVTNSLGGVPQLDEAWLKYHIPNTPVYLKAGNMKDPVYHEQIVRTRAQVSAERSLASDIFVNGDAYTKGATIIIDPNTNWRTEFGVTGGMRSLDTNFQDYPNNGSYNAFDYGTAGRFEFKAFGDWDAYEEMGSYGVKNPLLVFGAGADYSERGRYGQVVAVTDVQYDTGSGLTLYGGFLDRYTPHNFGIWTQGTVGASLTAPPADVLNKPTNEYAVVGQASYLFGQHWEPFGRYEFIHVQGTADGSRTWLQLITAGANYYFYGHHLKLTGQAVFLPEGLPFDNTAGDEPASPNGHYELVFVAQLQMFL